MKKMRIEDLHVGDYVLTSEHRLRVVEINMPRRVLLSDGEMYYITELEHDEPAKEPD